MTRPAFSFSISFQTRRRLTGSRPVVCRDYEIELYSSQGTQNLRIEKQNNIGADFSVKSTHRLVKEDHPRLTDARNGDGEATFHATTERLHAVVPDVR